MKFADCYVISKLLQKQLAVGDLRLHPSGDITEMRAYKSVLSEYEECPC